MEIAKITSIGQRRADSAKVRERSLTCFLLRVLFCSFAAVLFTSSYVAAATQYRLDYRVSHSAYGDIGTYSNLIETDGDTTIVTTALDIKVSILGLVAYRRDSRRVEKWNGDRQSIFTAYPT